MYVSWGENSLIYGTDVTRITQFMLVRNPATARQKSRRIVTLVGVSRFMHCPCRVKFWKPQDEIGHELEKNHFTLGAEVCLSGSASIVFAGSEQPWFHRDQKLETDLC